MKFIHNSILILILLLTNLNAYSQNNPVTVRLELFSFEKPTTNRGSFYFNLQIINSTDSIIEIPKHYITSSSNAPEANIKSEVVYLDCSKNSSFLLEVDICVPIYYYTQKINLKPAISHSIKTHISSFETPEKGNYKVRFTLKENFHSIGFNPVSEWIYFTVN